MLVKVKLGDVFYINWFHRLDTIYKLYRINYAIRQVYGVCIESNKVIKIIGNAWFRIDHIKDDKIYIDLGESFEGEFKVLPKLKAILCEYEMDSYWNYWSKYESSSK